MKLIIVRHGETEENAAGITQGHLPGRLSKFGKEQAQKLGERLKNEKIDFVYSSDLKRTKDTVKEILKHHKCPVIYDEIIRERSKGIFQGKPNNEYIKAVRKSGLGEYKFRPPQGENITDLMERAQRFAKKLLVDHKEDSTILICSHGMWITCFITYLLGLPNEEVFNRWYANCSVSELEVSKDKKANFKLYNCLRHLED